MNLSIWENQSFLGKTDILIVGAGITGLSTAIHVKKRHPDQEVLIIERGIIPMGASTKNAGFACIGSPSELLDDMTNLSSQEVFETVEKRWKGLKMLRETLGDKRIGYAEEGSYELFKPEDHDQFKQCLNQLDSLNKYLSPITGNTKVFKIDHDIIKIAGFKNFEHAISSQAEASIDPGKMMRSLIRKAYSLGIHFLFGTELKAYHKATAETNLGKIRYGKLALCTNGFSLPFLPDLDLKPARAQVILSKPIMTLPWKGIFHFDRGYYYFRNIGHRILLGGGRNLDFEGETTTVMNNTEQITGHLKYILETQIAPQLGAQIERSWSGIMGVGSVKKPIVRQLSEDTFCGIRLGGMGIAIGSLVGHELARLLME